LDSVADQSPVQLAGYLAEMQAKAFPNHTAIELSDLEISGMLFPTAILPSTNCASQTLSLQTLPPGSGLGLSTNLPPSSFKVRSIHQIYLTAQAVFLSSAYASQAAGSSLQVKWSTDSTFCCRCRSESCRCHTSFEG